jgi:hypothetical protein
MHVHTGYIFESQLVNALLGLFPQPPYRNVALKCLTEVGVVGAPAQVAALLLWGDLVSCILLFAICYFLATVLPREALNFMVCMQLASTRHRMMVYNNPS